MQSMCISRATAQPQNMVHSTSSNCRRRRYVIVSPQKMVSHCRSRSRNNPKRVRFAADLVVPPMTTSTSSDTVKSTIRPRSCATTTNARNTLTLENLKALWWDDRSLAQIRRESRAFAEQYKASRYQAALCFFWQRPLFHHSHTAASSFWLRYSLHWLVAFSDLRGLEQRVWPSLKLFRLRSSRAVLRLQHKLHRQRKHHCHHCVAFKHQNTHQPSIPTNTSQSIELEMQARSPPAHHDCLQNNQEQGRFLLRCASLQTSRAAAHLAYRLAQADEIEALRIYQEDKMLLTY
jgi:hypothetical protein